MERSFEESNLSEIRAPGWLRARIDHNS